MILEIPVYHHSDGSRTIGHPDQRHGVTLGRIAMAVLNARLILRHGAAKSCDCLSRQTGRPDYPCLIEDEQ
jgi:hypothetical protein